MNNITKELPRSFFIDMIKQLTTAPIGQMTEEIRISCIELLKKDPSSSECYNHLIWISKQPCPQDISSFIKVFCEVDKYYEKPNEHYDKLQFEHDSGSVRDGFKNDSN